MADAALLARAGHCYLRAGWPHEAARCYREAREHLRAARAWESAGNLRQAAEDYVAAGRRRQAAWLLVQHVGDAETARAVMADADAAPAAASDAPAPPTSREAISALLDRLVLARCDIAEGADPTEAVQALRAVADYLASTPTLWFGAEIEPWAVDLARSMNRPDLAALVYAGAVRGQHHGARDRWDEWSRRTLGVPLQPPEPT